MIYGPNGEGDSTNIGGCSDEMDEALTEINRAKETHAKIDAANDEKQADLEAQQKIVKALRAELAVEEAKLEQADAAADAAVELLGDSEENLAELMANFESQFGCEPW